MIIKCYFCGKETIKLNNYYGCVHPYRKHGKIFVRHFFKNGADGKLESYEVTWAFKHKRRSYEMVYWFTQNPYVVLYRLKGSRDIVASFRFIPDWTPENCKEKMSKVIAFA